MRATYLRIVTIAQLFIIGFSVAVLASEEPAFDRRTPIVKVYEQTHQAVVNIAGECLISSSAWPGYEWPDMFDFWGPRYQRQVAVLDSGLVVDSVSKASPADQQGISAGDLVLEIDGRRLTSVIDFYIKLMGKEVGEPIEVTYVKSSAAPLKSRTVKLTMQPRPLPDGRQLVSEFFQMEVSELTDQVARKFGFQSAYPILIVTGIERGGIAEKAGLVAGDLILQINDATVRNVRELSLEMEKINEGDGVDVKIMRISVGIFGQVQQRYTAKLTAQSKKSGKFLF